MRHSRGETSQVLLPPRGGEEGWFVLFLSSRARSSLWSATHKNVGKILTNI